MLAGHHDAIVNRIATVVTINSSAANKQEVDGNCMQPLHTWGMK